MTIVGDEYRIPIYLVHEFLHIYKRHPGQMRLKPIRITLKAPRPTQLGNGVSRLGMATVTSNRLSEYPAKISRMLTATQQ